MYTEGTNILLLLSEPFSMYKLLKLNNSTNSTLFQGQAYGHDLVGPFYHHSGPFGPFGFYANFFHEK